jgi:glycyl-tRNA synthetase beta chain
MSAWCGRDCRMRRFFWEQDRKTALAARRPALDDVTFQVQLGSLGARTERIQALVAPIAAAIAADGASSARAALLCKCDLLTAMVGEFPELQGIMGRYYALADGEAAQCAAAIAEHYLPRAAGDALPTTRAGSALALADKLDTLAGIFAIGQKPSGTRDPFGLRRAAIGVLRIVLEQRLELDLQRLIDQAVRAQPLPDIDTRAAGIVVEIYDYILERLRAQYLGAESTTHEPVEQRMVPISTELFDAVLAARPASLLDFEARLTALREFLASAEGASLAAANKRIGNILKKSASIGAEVDVALLRDPAELRLHEALQDLVQTDALIERRDYAAALRALARLRGAVDAFFDQVLVNDPDAALRANRLALLARLRGLFVRIADLSRLPG